MPVNSVDALKNRFNAALLDGKVTSQESDEIIALVKDGGGVTNSERRQVREQFILHGDKFEAAAKTRMDAFISNEIPNLLIDDAVVVDGNGRRDLPDPVVLKDDVSSVKYDWTAGNLFVDGPAPGDVIQGYIGNCYMVAGFAAIAAQSPETIENAVKDNGDGTFTVKFFDRPRWNSEPKQVEVTVDGQLPTRFGGLRYGKNRDKTELWVAILEKAYAQWKGGYEAIGNGGQTGAVMSALTGRQDTYTWLSPSSSHDEIFEQIKAALAEKKGVAAGTHGESRSDMYKGTGVYATHAYSIHSVEEKDGKMYVELRNPWGEVEPSGNGPDDGVFKLEMATFLKLDSSLYIC